MADTVITADELAELVKHPELAALEEVAVRTIEPGKTTPRTSKSSPAKKAPGPSSNSPARKTVLRLLHSADRPLTGGVVAQAAQKADPALLTSGWEKAGTFFPWLARAVPELAAASRPAPGFVWDPKRFSEADLPSACAVGLPPLQRQVVDACNAAGAPIGRASVSTVINGVLYAGLDLTARPTARKVAETWASNVVGLCRGARMELGPQDVAAIRAWVSGGLLKK